MEPTLAYYRSMWAEDLWVKWRDLFDENYPLHFPFFLDNKRKVLLFLHQHREVFDFDEACYGYLRQYLDGKSGDAPLELVLKAVELTAETLNKFHENPYGDKNMHAVAAEFFKNVMEFRYLLMKLKNYGDKEVKC
jgi:hypothetical protein